jgi:hypothetical protein
LPIRIDWNEIRLIGTKPSDKSSSNFKKRWVKNLSSKELSEMERKGLEHGLKFAVVPNRIPTAEIIASVEEGIFPLDDDAKRLVRAESVAFLDVPKYLQKTLIRMFSKHYLLLKKIRTGLFFQRTLPTKAIVLLLWTNMIIARRLFHCCITEIRILFSSLILLERLKEV